MSTVRLRAVPELGPWVHAQVPCVRHDMEADIMSETDRVEVREHPASGTWDVTLPSDVDANGRFTRLHHATNLLETSLCRDLFEERKALATTQRHLENQHKVSNASSAIIVKLREDQEQIRGAMLQWRARCGEAETERDDYERTEPKKVAELVSLRATIAAKDKTLVAVEDECVKLQKDRDNLKSLFDDAVRTCGIVMRERDAKVTVEEVGKWMHSWLYMKNVIENRALEDAIRYIDDDQAGLAAWRNRQKPEDGREGVEG